MDFFGDPLRNLTYFRPEARTSSEQRLLGWNVPPHELQHIPDHWLKYPEPPESMNYLLGLIYIFFTIFSLTGNGLVLYVFCSAKSLRTPSNVLVINLALCDFFMMFKTPIMIYNSFKCGFALGHTACQTFAIIGSYTGIAAGMTNACIAYDRFNVITRPMEGKMTQIKAIVMVICIYMYTTPFAILPALEFWGRFVPGWNVPPEDLQYIPEHWLTQPEPEHYMHYLLAALYVFMMITSFTGNGLVIFIFSSAKSLRTPSNLFVLNLAVFDIIMMTKGPIFIYNSLHHGFALGNTFCQIFATVGSYSGIGAGTTNAFIAYDRFNVITKPMNRSLTYTKAVILNIIIWIYCTPWIVMPITRFWGRFVPEGYLTSCSFDYLTDDFDTRLFVGTIFFCSFCMPTIMILYYYSQIVGHVFSHEKALREQAKKMNVESLRSNVDKSKETAEIRIAKAAITICFMFFVSWTPYGVMSLIGAFGDKSLLTPGVTMIPACTCKLVACIDPYVYAISHPRYRLELQKRLPWLAINEKAPESASAASTGTTQENQTTAA